MPAEGVTANADGRFAPSPSGPLHLGNLRTALLAWLFARSQGARFLVRVEDLDPERSRPEYEARQLTDLRRLGLDWDGLVQRQSQRGEAYRSAFARLTDADDLYPCWCTRAEIRMAASAPHGALPEGAYPGTCRRLSGRERAEREGSGRPPAWRLDAAGETVGFEDRVYGRCERVVDDFVVWRGDGTPAYNLAVVVDDSEQGIGEVVRGEDLLDTTPRQLLLASRLGLKVPRHAHVPLVLGPDGQRLAKRHGAVTLEDRLALGEDIDQVIGWMAGSLGLAPGGERLSAAQVLDGFAPGLITREATVFDGSQVPGPSG